MYYRDSEFYTSNSSVEVCDKADALYVDIESYEELEKERNELKAQVEQLKQSYRTFCDTNGSNLQDLHDSFAATPVQCLAEVRAQAGRDGFITGYKKLWHEVYGTEAPACAYKLSAENHANQIRQAAKD